MNDGYIKEETWFKCDIDNITYDCYLEYCSSEHLSKPWVEVTVRKYIQKKFWFFKWRTEEFECSNYPDITTEHYRRVNETLYFKPEPVKLWVWGALNRRNYELIEKKSQREEEKNIKVITEIR